ncbi:MAG: hypothetical protein EOP51_29140, partial [Sphingobacteriales bacterium]
MKNVIWALALPFLAAAAHKAEATQRFVPQQYATIQAAINASSPSDTVLVAPGQYFENLNFRGKNIVVGSRFITTQNRAFVKNTIINGSQPQYPDTASVALFVNGEDSTAVLAGFTLTGGKGTKWLDPHTSLVYREGGAILCQSSSPVIRDNYIYQNEAINTTNAESAGGGAIRADGGNVRILHNVISRNKGGYGTAIVLNFAGGIVRNNIICLNSGGTFFSGGSIWMHGVSAVPKLIENNTITGNMATAGTGGIVVMATDAIVRNNIIRGNGSSGQLQMVLPLNGTVSASYNLIEYGFAGTGNVDTAPEFADSAGLLLPASVAIDAGDPVTE